MKKIAVADITNYVFRGSREAVDYCKLEKCLELTPDGPSVEEKHKSHTKGLFTPPSMRWEKRIITGCSCELSWATTKQVKCRHRHSK